jgi:hypothetical protein
MIDVLTVAAIETRIKNMNANRKRGFPMEEFARFACVDYRHMKKMIVEGSMRMTETSQRRLSRALLALEMGEAGVRMDIAGRKFLGYHAQHEVRPTIKRGNTLVRTESGFALSIKPVNKYDYSQPHVLKKERG